MLGLKEQKRTSQTLGSGSPNNKIDGELDTLYLDTSNATLYVKRDAGKKIGWVAIGRVIGDGLAATTGGTGRF